MESNSLTDESYWGIDVGGTFAKVGFIANGIFEMVATLPTGENCRPEKLLEDISELILQHRTEPSAVGLGTAGFVDRNEGGVIRFSPNLPLWNGIKAGRILKDHLKIPVAVDNDCNAFAVGAINSGKIPSRGLWLFITLGTGIGGTIIHQGNIIYGTGYSGEFGHSTVKEGGIPCPCGSDGCWERYAGRKALEWYYSRLAGRKKSPKEIALMASHGETAALEAFREYGRWIGIGLANLANSFSPMGFFIGGGLSATMKHFETSAKQEYSRRCRHQWNTAVLENSSSAGAFGAASMAVKLC